MRTQIEISSYNAAAIAVLEGIFGKRTAVLYREVPDTPPDPPNADAIYWFLGSDTVVYCNPGVSDYNTLLTDFPEAVEIGVSMTLKIVG